MNAQTWLKSVSATADPYQGPSFEYLEGAPFAGMQFAGMNRSHVIDRAFIDPYDAKSVGLACYGGLSDYGTTLPIFAYHLRVNRNAKLVASGRRPLTSPILETPDYVPGRWLYGGEMMHHFGHFMAESSHRVYALTKYFRETVGLEKLDGVIFSTRMSLKSYSRDLFSNYYGISTEKIRLVRDRAAVIEHLEVRPQGSIIGGSALTSGYMDFLNFHQELNAMSVAKNFPRKIFLGRAHLSTGGGGIEDEHLLEKYLVSHGFTVVRPEEHPLLEQLEMLRQAELVVGIGGSFVHLYDHLGNTQSAMFLVSRGDPDSFYHDRTVRSKVSELEYYQPSSDRGDVGAYEDRDGRPRYVMKYNMERLLDATGTFLKAHG